MAKNTLSKNQKWTIGIAVCALLVSVASFLNNCSGARITKKQFETQEKQYSETKRDLEIEKLKNTAREWFITCEYDESFEQYKQVHLLDTIDDEGYRKFLDKGKNLLTIGNNKCDTVIKTFFERAKQLKNTPEINKLLEQCEQQ